jgi:hypothetical protein
LGIMASAFTHAQSSAKKWGGEPDEYHPIHDFFDETKALTADPRHRMLRHHAEGIRLMEQVHGPSLTLSTGRTIPTRWIGEQHMLEDFGMIPNAMDWINAVQPEPWMTRGAVKLDKLLTAA